MDNTGVSMPATKIFEDDDEFPAGDRWEAIARDVPMSDEFPNGLNYNFQYLGPADEAILRYDNANDAHGVGRHHRHYRGEVEGIDLKGLRSHIEKFLEDVTSGVASDELANRQRVPLVTYPRVEGCLRE